MKRKNLNEAGFIPLLITLFLIIAVIIYLVFSRVHHAQQ
jgi:hypothetical protein